MSTSSKPFAYLCTAGHVDVAPTMGTYANCQALVPVAGTRGRGLSPCACAIVKVPDLDGSLEATFRMGGPTAVLDVVKARAAQREGSPSAQLGR